MFLNTGGTLNDIRDLLGVSALDNLPEIKFPGYYLSETQQEMQLDMPQHTFAAEDGKKPLIIWAEDASIVRVTVAEEAAYQAEVADQEEDYD